MVFKSREPKLRVPLGAFLAWEQQSRNVSQIETQKNLETVQRGADYIVSRHEHLGKLSTWHWFYKDEKHKNEGEWIIKLLTRVQKAVVAKHCLAGLGSLQWGSEGPLTGAETMKPRLPLKLQDAGEARIRVCLSSRVESMGWRHPKTEVELSHGLLESW